MSTSSTPTESPIQPLHGQQAHVQIPQAPLGNANNILNAQTAALGTKALLAKKLAKMNKPKFNSPTDEMMTPCSAKLNKTKKKHFTKGKSIQPLFSNATLTADEEAAPNILQDSEPQSDQEKENQIEEVPLSDVVDPNIEIQDASMIVEEATENTENPFTV